LLADTAKKYVPMGIVPANDIRPFAPSILTPEGAPINEYEIGVVPIAVTRNVPPVPLIILVLAVLVKVGATGADVTVSVKFCVASGVVPLLAVIVN